MKRVDQEGPFTDSMERNNLQPLLAASALTESLMELVVVAINALAKQTRLQHLQIYWHRICLW